MKCAEAARSLHRFLDGELGAIGRWRLERHLARCPACRAELAALRTMRAAIRDLPVMSTPSDLLAKIGAAFDREPLPLVPAARPAWRPLAPIIGTGLAGAVAGAMLMTLLPRGDGDPAAHDVLASHLRSLMAGHLTDVTTTDRHAVKPWFATQLDASPPVADLADQGFPLVGGRLDYIDGHRAAAVVYKRRLHVINLFAWAIPGEPDAPIRATTRQGFHLLSWRRSGLSFWAVSDLDEAELREFAVLVEQPAARPANEGVGPNPQQR